MSGNNRNNDAGVGCIMWMLLAIIAMPILGIYFIATGDESQKILGWALLIVGLIIFAMGGN